MSENVKLARRNMPVLAIIKERFSKELPFKGVHIAMALHVTKETAVLVETLVEGGATIAIASCNPLSTQDDVSEYLKTLPKVKCYAHKGMNDKEYWDALDSVCTSAEDHDVVYTIDDGCDLVTLFHTKHKHLLSKVKGGCEETTTGIIRLKAMLKNKELKFPVVAVNDLDTKHLMDNYYGTGQSTIDGIIRATNTLFAGKAVAVAGYGNCGKGVAMRAKGLGAKVYITEVDPFKALQAHMDGFDVEMMGEVAFIGDIFITVTGVCDVITTEHMKHMKDGAIICNSGHFDSEIQVKEIKENGWKIERIRPWNDKITIPGNNVYPEKEIYLLGEGRLVNLACAEGHPSDVMDMSFAGQALACKYICQNKNLEVSLINLNEMLDQDISRLKLSSYSIGIDKLSEKQLEYINKGL